MERSTATKQFRGARLCRIGRVLEALFRRRDSLINGRISAFAGHSQRTFEWFVDSVVWKLGEQWLFSRIAPPQGEASNVMMMEIDFTAYQAMQPQRADPKALSRI